MFKYVTPTIELSFKSPFSHTSLLLQCFASQMALLGICHDSSLFTSPVTSINAGASDDRHCERECTWWWYPRGYEHYKLWLCPGSNPGHLCAKRVLYSLHYAPQALNFLYSRSAHCWLGWKFHYFILHLIRAKV